MTDLDSLIRARLDHEYPADSDDALRAVLDFATNLEALERAHGPSAAEILRRHIARELGLPHGQSG